eukprot:scaffold66520_cov20-Cyclotella_meneghiniana.AAC.1
MSNVGMIDSGEETEIIIGASEVIIIAAVADTAIIIAAGIIPIKIGMPTEKLYFPVDPVGKKTPQ